jgi:hypothetical protein
MIGQSRIMRDRWASIFHVALPVFVGVAIYTLWRSPHLLVFDWYQRVGLSVPISLARSTAAPIKRSIPAVVLYSVPDAMWVYAFTSALTLIWMDRSSSAQRNIWLVVPSVLALGAEFGQALHVVPGTFDWADVACYIIAGVLGLLLPRIKLSHISLNRSEVAHAAI